MIYPSQTAPFDKPGSESKILFMEYRFLGGSGFRVPVLTFGTGTFGGKGQLFSAWGSNGVPEAKRLVDICLDSGLTMFDSADGYSDGMAEEILGRAVTGQPRQSARYHQRPPFAGEMERTTWARRDSI